MYSGLRGRKLRWRGAVTIAITVALSWKRLTDWHSSKSPQFFVVGHAKVDQLVSWTVKTGVLVPHCLLILHMFQLFHYHTSYHAKHLLWLPIQFEIKHINI